MSDTGPSNTARVLLAYFRGSGYNSRIELKVQILIIWIQIYLLDTGHVSRSFVSKASWIGMGPAVLQGRPLVSILYFNIY